MRNVLLRLKALRGTRGRRKRAKRALGITIELSDLRRRNKMAIQTCKQCGGLWADKPGETYAGTACSCVGEANKEQPPPEIRSSEWVEELATSWERRAENFDKWSKDYKSPPCDAAAQAIRDCIKELRAGSESRSSEWLDALAESFFEQSGKCSDLEKECVHDEDRKRARDRACILADFGRALKSASNAKLTDTGGAERKEGRHKI